MCLRMFCFSIFVFRKICFAIREGGRKSKTGWMYQLLEKLLSPCADNVPIRKADSGNDITLPI